MSSIQVYNSRGNRYVRIVESYRDPITKKPKVKVLKTLGREDELEAREPGIVERLKREFQESRSLSSSIKNDAIFDKIKSQLNRETEIETEGFPLINYGVKVYEKIWTDLNLDYFFDYRQKKDSKITYKVKELASLLVYSRLLDPGSKKKTFEHRNQFLHDISVSFEHIYRVLPFLSEQKINLEKHLNRQLSKKIDRNLSVAFYDVTTYYFESVRADELKKFGYSKDNKVNQVQVVMGLLIDDHGIPISYEIFPGNTNDFKTLEPVMRRLKEEYGINKVIVTADRGLNSKQNLAFLKSIGFDYVMAYKIRSSSKQVKNLVLENGDYTSVSQQFKWKVSDFSTQVVYNGQKIQLDDQMVITWSSSREAKDKQDRERLIEKSLKLVESKSALKAELKKGGKKYVQLNLLEDEQISFNQERLAQDELFDGYYGIQFSDKTLAPEKVVDIYHGLWKIEESFRVMKSNFEARPIFVWTEDSIKGHFIVCYLSLVIQRYLEYLLKQEGISMSTERIQDALRQAQVTIIKDKETNEAFYVKNESNKDLSVILQALKIKEIPQFGKLKDLKR
ncbi:IS1634 family transposase [Granulicatella seriolae]|uniref:IS1634 family transposase n=1 Tax=Granulicatella seriolae TaxID=2967226 RepID=A0ABT1WMH1_9LACT|nr:IS1634 family transposase [Granulicatella seriolae]